MHSGKMFEEGKKEAYVDCYHIIEQFVKEKDGFIKHADSDGTVMEYCPIDALQALGIYILGRLGS